MNELANKRAAFLNRNVAHFNSTNLARRGNYMDTDKSICAYDHAVNGGCMIGRNVPAELALQLDVIVGGVDNTEIFTLLPAELQELGLEFLYNCQRLHDLKPNWNETGLSQDGLMERARIVFEYCQETSV